MCSLPSGNVVWVKQVADYAVSHETWETPAHELDIALFARIVVAAGVVLFPLQIVQNWQRDSYLELLSLQFPGDRSSV